MNESKMNAKLSISRLPSFSVGSLTWDCVTRLIVAPNMGDPISIKDSDSRLNLSF